MFSCPGQSFRATASPKHWTFDSVHDCERMLIVKYVTAALLMACSTSSLLLAEDPEPNAPKFTSSGHTTDSIGVVKQRVASKEAVLLDVREQEEWDAGHLKAAKLVPLSAVKSDMLTKEMKKHLSKDKPIYVHCRSGGRVLQVSEILRKQGYDIRPLKLGYSKLLGEGFEKAKDKK